MGNGNSQDIFNGSVSPSTYYAIKNRATGKVLDHWYGKEIQAYNEDENHSNHQWSVRCKENGTFRWYAIKNKATGNVLDHWYGRKIKANNNDENHHNHQWRFIYKGDGYYAIKNKASGGVLDHYYGSSIIAFDDNEEHHNHQWKLIPKNFKLKATISHFDFGDEKELRQLIEESKHPEIIFDDELICRDGGKTVKSIIAYSQSFVQTFSYGFSESLGFGVETEVSCGIPGIQGKQTYKWNITFSANQQWTETDTKTFSTTLEVTPDNPGKYKTFMIVFVAKDQKLDFTARVRVSAYDGNRRYCGSETKAFLCYNKYNFKITNVADQYVEGTISGTMTASFCVRTVKDTVRIGDVPSPMYYIDMINGHNKD